MAELSLTADTGRPTGSGPARRMRAEGRVPGVVYGLGGDPVPVSVVWRELRQILTTDAGMNALIDLHVGEGASELVIVKEMQRHPVRRDVLHVDFLRVSRDIAITVDVPIVLEGEASAVTSEGGIVDHTLFALSISAKPADIPNEITVDISGLTLGDTIRVGDLSLPRGVELHADPDDAVVTTSVPASEPEEGAEAEGEAGEAAEAPEGDGGDADGGDAEGGDGGE